MERWQVGYVFSDKTGGIRGFKKRHCVAWFQLLMKEVIFLKMLGKFLNYHQVYCNPSKIVPLLQSLACFFSRKTFRRRVLQKIVGVSHTRHIPHISITPHISHTYPFKTYPTNTYPTNTYPFNKYPTSTYPFNAYPFKRFASVLHTFPFKTYPTNTYPTNTFSFNTYPTNTYPCDAYPFNAYPFKRCASAGIANVSHQYISHQYVSMRIHSKGLHQQEWQCIWMQTYPCISLHQQEWQCMWMQTYPCISLSSRNGNEYEYHCMSFHTIATRREW